MFQTKIVHKIKTNISC